jgi:hypothetical protein
MTNYYYYYYHHNHQHNYHHQYCVIKNRNIQNIVTPFMSDFFCYFASHI